MHLNYEKTRFPCICILRHGKQTKKDKATVLIRVGFRAKIYANEEPPQSEDRKREAHPVEAISKSRCCIGKTLTQLGVEKRMVLRKMRYGHCRTIAIDILKHT